MVLVSLAIHLAIIAVVLLLPNALLRQPPPPLVSYSVDLIAPDKVGGTNVIEGGKGRVAAAPLAAAPEAQKAPEPKPEAPREAAKPEPAGPEAPKPEPPQVAEQPKPEPKPQEPPKPPAEEAAKKDEMVLAMKATPHVEPPAPPTARPPEPTVAKPAPTQPKAPPTAAKVPPTPAAKPETSPRAIAKAHPSPAPPTPRANAKATEASKVAEARATAEVKKTVEAHAAAEAKKAAEAKAAGEARAAEAKKRDDQIAAAVRRAEQRVGERGGGTGTAAGEQPGGAISVGPGEGAGGTVAGVEYLLYYNHMINRIKESWAWASRGRALEAVIRFSIAETGEVLNVRIVRASGDASFDASVERAVRAVNPLQPPPAAYRKEFADVELTFRPEDLEM